MREERLARERRTFQVHEGWVCRCGRDYATVALEESHVCPDARKPDYVRAGELYRAAHPGH